MRIKTKKVDAQKRVIPQRDRRDRHLREKKAIDIYKGDTVEVSPATKSDLTRHFDRIQVDLKSDLSDWPKVRKELKRLSP